MADVLKYPLGPVPYSLATADGTLCKTTKATLANALKKKAAPERDLPGRRATIIYSV